MVAQVETFTFQAETKHLLDLMIHSRQMLQQDRQVTQIRKGLTKKVLDSLQAMSESEPEKFELVWEQFGRSIKGGRSFGLGQQIAHRVVVALSVFAS